MVRTSTKIISKSDLPFTSTSKYYRYPYVVHSEKSKFLLGKSTISNGILSGTINQMDESYFDMRKIHLYLASDSLIKIDKVKKEKVLSVPVNEITKVELIVPSVAKNAILIYLIIGLVVGGLFLYYVSYAIYLLISAPA